MQKRLRFNIADFRTSYITNSTFLQDAQVRERLHSELAAGLEYACFSWSDHLTDSTHFATIVPNILVFFGTRFFFWLEILSLLNRVAEGSVAIQKLLSVLAKVNST
jgi:hypothetical protein